MGECLLNMIRPFSEDIRNNFRKNVGSHYTQVSGSKYSHPRNGRTAVTGTSMPHFRTESNIYQIA